MALLNVDSLETARDKLLRAAACIEPGTETLPLQKAAGRVLARDIASPVAVPAFDRSTVDGYALKSADTAAAGESIPVFLTLSGKVEMGRAAPCAVSSGQCAGIPTGGMLPEGADAVVMVEYTEPFGDGVAVYAACAPGENTVLAGEDIKKGETVLKGGTKLLPRHIGALAAAGITGVEVFSPLKLGLISTGDEVKAPGEMLEAGQVYDINSPAIAALARRGGYEVAQAVLLPDDEEILKNAVEDAMSGCDLVLVSGGSSQGEKDVTAKVLDGLSTPGVFTHGLALKPGKPTILGFDDKSRTVLGGLPGHPVSAMMVFELLFSWFYRQKTGMGEPFAIPARLMVNLASSPGKLNCWPARLEQSAGGYAAVPVFGKSGLITSLTEADGYFTVGRAREGINAGETVFVHLF